MYGFCIGDRVRSSEEKSVGKVIGFHRSETLEYILVEFDSKKAYFHDGHDDELNKRKGKQNHCYYCTIKELKKIN